MGETAVVMNISHQEAVKSRNGQSLETIVQLDKDNGGGATFSTRTFRDVQGRVTSVEDSLGRLVTVQQHDMVGQAGGACKSQ